MVMVMMMGCPRGMRTAFSNRYDEKVNQDIEIPIKTVNEHE
jgi:hypothetical protein